MARSRVSLTRKKQLNRPDEFISRSSRLLELILANKIQISVVAGLLLALALTFSGSQYYLQKKEDKASAQLATTLKEYRSIVKDKEIKQAYTDIENDFLDMGKEYAGTTAGKFAGLAFANICYRAGEYDKAVSLYEQALKDFEDTSVFKNLVLSSLAYAYEAQNNTESAITNFEKVVTGHSNILKGNTFFNLGRLYNEMGEKDKSSSQLKELIAIDKECIYLDLAKEKVGG